MSAGALLLIVAALLVGDVGGRLLTRGTSWQQSDGEVAPFAWVVDIPHTQTLQYPRPPVLTTLVLSEAACAPGPGCPQLTPATGQRVTITRSNASTASVLATVVATTVNVPATGLVELSVGHSYYFTVYPPLVDGQQLTAWSGTITVQWFDDPRAWLLGIIVVLSLVLVLVVVISAIVARKHCRRSSDYQSLVHRRQ